MLSPLFASLLALSSIGGAYDRDNVVEEISAKVSRLPFELQCEAVDFIEFIAQRTRQGVTQAAPSTAAVHSSCKSVFGALEHLNLQVSLEDLAEVRREMWANFPCED